MTPLTGWHPLWNLQFEYVRTGRVRVSTVRNGFHSAAVSHHQVYAGDRAGGIGLVDIDHGRHDRDIVLQGQTVLGIFLGRSPGRLRVSTAIRVRYPGGLPGAPALSAILAGRLGAGSPLAQRRDICRLPCQIHGIDLVPRTADRLVQMDNHAVDRREPWRYLQLEHVRAGLVWVRAVGQRNRSTAISRYQFHTGDRTGIEGLVYIDLRRQHGHRIVESEAILAHRIEGCPGGLRIATRLGVGGSGGLDGAPAIASILAGCLRSQCPLVQQWAVARGLLSVRSQWPDTEAYHQY